MPDPDSSSGRRDADLDWYRRQWEELQDILSVDRAEAVTGRVRELRLDALQDRAEVWAKPAEGGDEAARRVLSEIRDHLRALRDRSDALDALCDALDAPDARTAAQRVQALKKERDDLRAAQQSFRQAGFDDPEDALEMIRTMEAQLDQLYGEKESTLKSERRAEEIAEKGGTFEQLEALLAREEKLQRELGISSSDEIIAMVNGLVDQLEDLYDRQGAARPESVNGTSVDAPFDRLEELLDREQTLQDELGVSSPDEVVAMVRGLTRQLEDLYTARERLARVNLDDADSVIEMVNSMKAQLEVLYEDQERLSNQGIDGVDHALSMIESMEAQLTDLYEKQQTHGASDEKLQRLHEQLESLRREKEDLLERREALEAENASYAQTVSALEDTLGTSNPETISSLVDSMEKQLADVYQSQESPADPEATPPPPLIDRSDLEEIDSRSAEELHALPVGAFCLADDGTVRRANRAALQWPSAEAASPDALTGRDFFFDLAPATNNPPFRGRFSRGVREENLDTRFSYTYVARDVPLTGFVVQMYRTGDDANWILFQPVTDRSP